MQLPSGVAITLLINKQTVMIENQGIDIKELRAIYKEKIGKKPFNGWTVKQLREKLNLDVDYVEYIDEDLEAQIAGIIEETLDTGIPPAFKEGKPYMIMKDEYIPFERGKIVILECFKRIANEELEHLKKSIN